jgi:hypothetical protein
MTDVVFGQRERDHNTCGVGAIGSVRKEGKSFVTVRSGEGAEGLTWKPSDFTTSVKLGAE